MQKNIAEQQFHHVIARMTRLFHHIVCSHILLKLSELSKLGKAMASLILESDKAAIAKALGAVPKYPARQFLLPTPKPKPRPQPRREEPETIVAADAGKKRKVEEKPQCTCNCKVRRLLDALTELDKLLVSELRKQK